VTIYKVKVETTHAFSLEALQALWTYHRSGEPFGLRKAMTLARQLLSTNPEMDEQILEGHELMKEGDIDNG